MKYLKPIITVFMVLLLSSVITNHLLSSQVAADKLDVSQGIKFFRVYFHQLKTAQKIVISMNTFESKYEKGYIVVEVTNPEEYRRLLETGLEIEEIANPLEGKIEAMQEAALIQTNGIPFYPCYRTVEETFATAESMAATYPGLATWTDQGDSWEKVNDLGGYDMKVLRLTNSAVAGLKPKLFLTGAIHANEYSTAELVTRLAQYLVENYGTDPDVTWMLDYHEIHIMLQSNPDGRKKAEMGLSWRKNTNKNYCSPNSNSRGADLNRNFAFKWNCCGGSSADGCQRTYHGAYAASEPETRAIQNYMMAQFPDQRGPNDTDPAPLDATGIYLDIHSHGRMILWPWSWTSEPPPNAPGLQTLGRKMAFFNGYTPFQGYALYNTDGTSKLFAYGELGIPAYTIEVGTRSFQDCSYFEDTLVPDNIPFLLYALKVVRTPYITPAGPDSINLGLDRGSTPAGVPSGTIVTLTAAIDDTRFNNSGGTEPIQNIFAAEYYVDTPPWITNPAPAAIAMSPADGAFNSTIEAVAANIDTNDWSEGRHIIFVRGQDTDGNWGAFSAVFLYIVNNPDTDPPTPNPVVWRTTPYATGTDSISMTAATAADTSGVEYYFQCLTTGGHHSGWQDSTVYEDTGLTPGILYTYRVKARDKSYNRNETAWSVEASAAPVCNPPAAPSHLKIDPVSYYQANLIWRDNSNHETTFKIERSLDNTNFSQIDLVGANMTSYSDTGVEQKTTYWYRVRASNSCGDSGFSNTVRAIIPVRPSKPPAEPKKPRDEGII